jgi:pimeloyl-ACP methyl ester carboxylesterase
MKTANPITSMFAAIIAIAACHQPEGTPTTATRTKAKQTGYAPVNGLSYYYEVRGEGEPLLLLHGGLGSMEMFGPLLDGFGAGRKLILVDLQGHGRTALGTRDIDLVAIGDDLAGVLAHLQIERADVLGYSFGGGAALRLAVQHPTMVRRLVVVSAGFADDGFYPEMKAQQAAVGAGMAEMMKETPMYRSCVAVAPKPDEFPRLLDQMGAWMRRSYNWAEDVKKIAAPTMLVFGDGDMYRPEHVVEFYQLLGGGKRDAGWQREHMAKNRLAILPDLTHYEMFLSPALVSSTRPFLDGKSSTPSRAGQVEAKK